MILRIIREPSLSGTTMGVLFVDDRFFAFTLEDQLREPSTSSWKVPGATAIPQGRYRVTISYSPKFGRELPEVLGVPGFTGIRLHPGNSHEDTEGCILIGARRAGVKLLNSRVACDELQSGIEAALTRGEPVWMVLENPLAH